MKEIAILGSTGSIGRQALKVVDNHPEKMKVVALAAGHNFDLLLEQIKKYHPKVISVAERPLAERLKAELGDSKIEIAYGLEGLNAVATCEEAKVVLTAVSGVVGLVPTVKAIEAGKDIALANKETLVAAGSLVMKKIKDKKVNLFPVDSEHSAIWQCMQVSKQDYLAKIWITASGGPFREMPAEKMASITPAMALKHPNWNMGNKITIDSATLMNKGLEVIEACWLFDVSFKDIQVVVHPQSIIHSMVEYVDGSVVAHLGIPDMRIPIQYAFSYPQRWENNLPKLDLFEVAKLTFEKPDLMRFPCLKLAFEALKTGGSMPVVLNAANEVSVARFLKREIGFMDIPRIVTEVMDKHEVIAEPELDEILAVDQWARKISAK